MIVLGIETSCDETAVDVVEDGRTIHANVVSSSVQLHEAFGGVVPEIACRAHVEALWSVVETAVSRAGVALSDMDLIAVTEGPGLVGALLVGISFAKALSLALGVPLVGVGHLSAHLYAGLMEDPTFTFPFIGLVVSGGHTLLAYAEEPGTFHALGETRDDAVGEAFDKVAKLLGLGYPGGPIIERRAAAGDPRRVTLPRLDLDDSPEFSFSGMKTAVLYQARPRLAAGALDDPFISDMAASFQERAVEVLTTKALAACERQRSDRLLVGGGVAANTLLRQRLTDAGRRRGIHVLFPRKELCLDNGAMVAGLGGCVYARGHRSDPAFSADPALKR